MSFQRYNVYEGLTACRVVDTSNLAGTYFNGQTNNGVGATLTVTATGALVIDGVTLANGDSVLLQGQSAANQNGIYIVSNPGATGIQPILTRRGDMQNIEQIRAGQYVSIGAGTANAGAMFAVVEPLPAQFGISNLEFNAMITSGLGTAAAKAASDNTKASVASVSGATTAGHLLSAADTAGTVTDSGVVANTVLFGTIVNPDASPDLVSFDVTVGQAALAAGGSVALVTSSGSKQYRIRVLQLNSGGTNFSGGGGDRLGQVTDGTTVYSVIPAANMQSLVNAGWGINTVLPYPATAAIFTPTAAGANLRFQYSGGTTDYSAGSLRISGIAERIA